MNAEPIIDNLKHICQDTGTFINRHFRQLSMDQVEVKEKNSLVSFVDKEAESALIEALEDLLPEATFLTEEAMVTQRKHSLRWIVDPLDGTTNFVVGIPHFSISIALESEGKIILGIVYNVMQKECYYAIIGKGAYLDDKPLKVSGPKPLDECGIATGFPYDKRLIKDGHIDTLSYFIKNARSVRRLGSASLDLCLVASGTFDLYYEHYLNAWDVAAGALIVSEAGGTVTDMTGGQNYLFNRGIIACPAFLENERQRIISFFKG